MSSHVVHNISLLTLPIEVLFEICFRLDYRGLHSIMLATIWCENYGRLRSGEVSDRHFVLCSGSKDFGTLQFHRLADDPTVSQQFVKLLQYYLREVAKY